MGAAVQLLIAGKPTTMLALLAMTAILQSPDMLLHQIDPARMRATVEKLASWHDRNTNNPTLTEAAEWIAGEYRKIPGMQVEIMHYPAVKGQRIKQDKDVVQVVATLPGATERRVVIGGHFDTINMTAGPEGQWTLPSPGANDDGSGTALALELARVMAQGKWNQTMIFVAFSGEEQGLLGSTALAKRAKAENWKIEAVLSNDMIGTSRINNGQGDPHHVRLFSEEVPPGARTADGQPVLRHNSRELARFIEWTTRDKVKGFNVKLVFRADRFGRGGDHTPFNREGFTAVRFVDPYEEYTHQHTEKDLPQYMDWNQLANSARMNLLAAMSLANATEGPTDVRIDRAQGHDTTVTWKGSAPEYVLYWRETSSPVWQHIRAVKGSSATVDKVSKDDFIFAVGAVGGVPVDAR